ncbi:HNH endonuclease [Microbacterium enclense]|uniref:HNH endonuclease n=1 Tax=Microbacterium enclense TaxID=993073 RepID=UPI002041830F|nr:HNH endonuclease signature motif containing protein [Microbacterium enclense]MCM3614603.1 HNH endonuclease [Microbacterium enclense]
MSDDRPDIPEPMKREVRQRCGFGCVICGSSIYQYDHMVEWSQLQEHTVENLTLLCGTHHDEKTKGLLPLATVQQANASPINVRNGVTEPYGLHYGPKAPLLTVHLGDNKFMAGVSVFPFFVDGDPLIFFQSTDDGVGLYVTLRDDYNRTVLRIWNNELIHRADLWDVRFEGTTLTVRDAPGDLRLVIRFAPPADVYIERAKFQYNGVQIDVKPTKVTVGGQTMSGSAMINVGTTVGWVIGDRHPEIESAFSWQDISRVPVKFGDGPPAVGYRQGVHVTDGSE